MGADVDHLMTERLELALEALLEEESRVIRSDRDLQRNPSQGLLKKAEDKAAKERRVRCIRRILRNEE